MQHLEELRLVSLGLAKEGWVAVLNKMEANPNIPLKKLLLPRNSLEDRGVLALAGVVEKVRLALLALRVSLKGSARSVSLAGVVEKVQLALFPLAISAKLDRTFGTFLI
jgi:hypothetical protein